MAPNSTRDHEVVVAGDMESKFSEIFREHSPLVLRFFMRRGFSDEDARDLMQDTFLKVYSGLKFFRDDANLKTWILSIAANVWKNAVRTQQSSKRGAAKTVSFDDVSKEALLGRREPLWSHSGPGPLHYSLRNERSRLLREAVQSLPDQMRQCVLLRIDRGLKYHEIASILSLSVDTVKVQLYLARKRLSDDLQEYFSESHD